MPFREAIFFQCFLLLFCWGTDGSTIVKIARMCSSGREELRRACSTSPGERNKIGFLSATLDEGVFTVVELCRDIFVLILAGQGKLLQRRTSFGLAHFLDPCG